MPRVDREPDGEIPLKQIEVTMALANLAFARLDARRSYEWKITFGVWALLAAAMARGFSVIPLTGVVLMVLYGRWLHAVWVRHGMDTNIAWHYYQSAQAQAALLGVKGLEHNSALGIGSVKAPKARKPSWTDKVPKFFGWMAFMWNWAIGFQFFVAAFLFLALYLTADRISLYSVVLKAGSN